MEKRELTSEEIRERLRTPKARAIIHQMAEEILREQCKREKAEQEIKAISNEKV